MTKHQLKSWPPYFEATLRGFKTFDVRRDDREGGFNVGDHVELLEWDAARCRPTSRKCVRRVSFVLRGADAERFGVQPGHVVLGLEKDPEPW